MVASTTPPLCKYFRLLACRSKNTFHLSNTGYSDETQLEKWARDSKITDIFEGTQQIQQLAVARRLLGLSSSELK